MSSSLTEAEALLLVPALVEPGAYTPDDIGIPGERINQLRATGRIDATSLRLTASGAKRDAAHHVASTVSTLTMDHLILLVQEYPGQLDAVAAARMLTSRGNTATDRHGTPNGTFKRALRDAVDLCYLHPIKGIVFTARGRAEALEFPAVTQASEGYAAELRDLCAGVAEWYKKQPPIVLTSARKRI